MVVMHGGSSLQATLNYFHSICDSENVDCMKSTCKGCRLATYVSAYIMEDLTDEDDEILEFHVNQWDGGQLVRNQYPPETVVHMLQDQLRHYTKHIYNPKTQTCALTQAKHYLKEGNIILQTDFAENYAIKQ